MEKSRVIIAVDFDGTIVEHAYPEIGKDVGALPWLRMFADSGTELILWTMRSGDTLEQAVDYCDQGGVRFFGVNSNPSQGGWTKSPKAYANLYIDDAAFGCPLVYPESGRPYVDWNVVGPAVLEQNRRLNHV